MDVMRQWAPKKRSLLGASIQKIILQTRAHAALDVKQHIIASIVLL